MDQLNKDSIQKPEIDEDFLKFIIEYLKDNADKIPDLEGTYYLTEKDVKDFLLTHYDELQNSYIQTNRFKNSGKKTLVNNMSLLFTEVVRRYFT